MLPFNKKLVLDDLLDEMSPAYEAFPIEGEDPPEREELQKAIDKARERVNTVKVWWDELHAERISPTRGHPFYSVAACLDRCEASVLVQGASTEDYIEWYKSFLLTSSTKWRRETIERQIRETDQPSMIYAYVGDGDHHGSTAEGLSTINIWGELVDGEEEESVAQFLSQEQRKDNRLVSLWFEHFDQWRADGQPAVEFKVHTAGPMKGEHAKSVTSSSGWTGVGHIAAYMTLKIADYVVDYSEGVQCLGKDDAMKIYNGILESLIGKDVIDLLVKWFMAAEVYLKNVEDIETSVPETMPVPTDHTGTWKHSPTIAMGYYYKGEKVSKEEFDRLTAGTPAGAETAEID